MQFQKFVALSYIRILWLTRERFVPSAMFFGLCGNVLSQCHVDRQIQTFNKILVSALKDEGISAESTGHNLPGEFSLKTT
jgi:hypothetical protein